MKKKYFILLAILCVFYINDTYSQDSFLDQPFGTNGKVVYENTGFIPSHTSKIAQQSDGKIIIGGGNFSSQVSYVTRINTDGSIDNSFGDNGYIKNINVVEEGFNYTIKFIVTAIGVNPDNSLIIAFKPAGYNYGVDPYYYYIKKFSANGIIDNSFQYVSDNNIDLNKQANVIKCLPNNKILIGGGRYTSQGGYSTLFKQLNADGSIDITFVKDIYYSGGIITDIQIQNDGKYIIIGNRPQGEYNQISYCGRINADGSTDVYFGNFGFVALPNFYNSKVLSCAIQPDGKIVIGGVKSDNSYWENSKIYTLRLNSNGTTDTSFGTNGININNQSVGSQYSLKLFLDSNQNIYTTYSNNNYYDTNNYLKKINIDKLSSSGQYITTIQKSVSFFKNQFTDLLQTQTGELYFIANTHNFYLNTLIKTDEALNNISSFGNNGVVSFGFEGISLTPLYLYSSLVQNDGKILVSGSLGNHFLKRFNTDGSEDLVFNNNSKYNVEVVDNFTIQSNNKILIAHNKGVYRLNQDGTLDTTFATNGYLETIYTDLSKIMADNNDNIYVVTFYNGGKIYKYTPNGLSYTNFGTNGIADFTGLNYTDAILQGENIYIGGTVNIVTVFPFYQTDFAIKKMLSNGVMDTTFGNNGLITTSFSLNADDNLKKLHLTSDNNIVAVGESGGYLAFAKYNLQGSLDENFGILGRNKIQQNNYVDSVSHPDNSISIVSNLSSNNIDNAFKLTHISNSGWADLNFGNNGEIITDFDETPNTSNNPKNLILQPDNKLIVVGSNNDLLLARYNNNLLANDNFNTSIFNINVYPNPFVNYLFIEFINKTNSNIINYSIYDITGKTILKNQDNISLGTNTLKLNLPININKGYYFLKIEFENSSKTFKLFKN